MSKLAIFTLGSHGDVRPYVALGVELLSRGHEVTLVTNPEDAPFCKSWGLKWKPLSGDLRKEASVVQGFRDDLENKTSGMKKFHVLREVMGAINRLLDQQFRDVLAAAQEADALIYNPSVFCASHVGQALGKPFFQLQLQPEIRTTNHSSSFTQSKPLFGKLGNLASHLFFEQLFWQAIRKKINQWRCTQLNLAKVNFFGPTYDPFLKKQPKWIAVSPYFLPSPKDWKKHIEMTGFLFLQAATSYEPSEDLLSFLKSGQTPLYVGLGSLEGICPKYILGVILEVLQEKNLRCVVSSGLPLNDMPLPDHCFLLGHCPHDWLFPQVSAVIHSGGAGTTAAGLKAGKPTLILPFATDQFFWGRQVFERGLGPSPIPLKKVQKKVFEPALQDLISNPHYQKNAQALSCAIQQEEGLKNIANRLESALINLQKNNPRHFGSASQSR